MQTSFLTEQFQCPVGEEHPRAFRYHVDLETPANDILFTDIPCEDPLKGFETQEELKITSASTDTYSVRLWKMTAARRKQIRTQLLSDRNGEPIGANIIMTENEIKETVLQHLRAAFKSVIDGQTSVFLPLHFDFRKEYEIQIGCRRCRADLVMLINDAPIVIVECKRSGIIGEGIEQLEGYICASGARLGIFANNPNPNNWIYLEKCGINQFIKIDHDIFRELVWTETRSQREIEQSIQERKEQHIRDKASRLVTPNAIQERADKIIEQQAKKRITEGKIQSSVLNHQNEKIEQQTRLIAELENMSGRRFWAAFWGWFILIILILGLVSSF